MAESFVKDPNASLDYEWDWAAWLDGDTIASHTVVATGLTVVSSTASTTAVVAWLSGGTAGATYVATCHIATAAGRQDDRSITIRVENR